MGCFCWGMISYYLIHCTICLEAETLIHISGKVMKIEWIWSVKAVWLACQKWPLSNVVAMVVGRSVYWLWTVLLPNLGCIGISIPSSPIMVLHTSLSHTRLFPEADLAFGCPCCQLKRPGQLTIEKYYSWVDEYLDISGIKQGPQGRIWTIHSLKATILHLMDCISTVSEIVWNERD